MYMCTCPCTCAHNFAFVGIVILSVNIMLEINYIPYFLKYSQSKMFVFEHNLCISEIIKLCGWSVSAKIKTLWKLSVAKVNSCEN